VQIERLRLSSATIVAVDAVIVAVAAVPEPSAGIFFVGSSEEIGRESSVSVFAASLESEVGDCMAMYDSYYGRSILYLVSRRSDAIVVSSRYDSVPWLIGCLVGVWCVVVCGKNQAFVLAEG
jgi:hypothetical protein